MEQQIADAIVKSIQILADFLFRLREQKVTLTADQESTEAAVQELSDALIEYSEQACKLLGWKNLHDELQTLAGHLNPLASSLDSLQANIEDGRQSFAECKAQLRLPNELLNNLRKFVIPETTALTLDMRFLRFFDYVDANGEPVRNCDWTKNLDAMLENCLDGFDANVTNIGGLLQQVNEINANFTDVRFSLNNVLLYANRQIKVISGSLASTSRSIGERLRAIRIE